MRVIVTTRLYPPEPGAASYRLAAMVSALEDAGHSVTVLTSRYPGAAVRNPSVRRWPVLRDKTGSVRGYLQYASFDLPLFFRLLLAGRFDVVVVEPPPTTGVVVRLVTALRRRPFVYFAGDVSSVAAQGIGVPVPVVKVLRRVERWAMSGAECVLSVSSGVSAAVQKLVGAGHRVVDVGTGIDTDRFALDGPDAGEAWRYFVYAGTMSEIQGAGVFVDGFARIAEEFPDVRLLMFGAGVETAELQRRGQSLGAQVQFRGIAASEEIAAALRGSVAGLASVRPSRGYDFAYATKALASMACGAPVIYSGVGPLGEVVEREQLGYSVDWEPEAVADAMRQALATPLSASERRRISRWVQENHSLGAVGARAAEAIEQAAATR